MNHARPVEPEPGARPLRVAPLHREHHLAAALARRAGERVWAVLEAAPRVARPVHLASPRQQAHPCGADFPRPAVPLRRVEKQP
jgi:hypothetical protein